MSRQRGDFWGILQDYEQRASKAFAEATTLAKIDDLERKGLLPEKGIIARLEREPILSEASASARKVFVKCLTQHIRNHARYARVWVE